MARQNASAALPTVSLTQEALKEVLRQAIEEHEQQKAAKVQAERSDEMDALTVKTFKRAGFKDVELLPRQDILTFNLWIRNGMRRMEGKKAIHVKNLRLFHISQCRPMTEADYKALAPKKSADKLPMPSPVLEPAPTPQPTPAPKPSKSRRAKPATNNLMAGYPYDGASASLSTKTSPTIAVGHRNRHRPSR